MAQNDDVIAKEFDRFLDKFADRVFFHSQENLVRQNKIDTGTLLKTANIQREFLVKQIIYPANYADSIEYGRAAGSMPPVDPLVRWVRRKFGLKEKEARQRAWAIAISIKKRGIQSSPFLRPAITTARKEFEV